MIRRRILFAGLLVALFAIGWWVGRGGAASRLYSNLDLFVEILHKVEQDYVDPAEPSRLIDGALKGMLRDLDPYSQYLDQKSYANLQSFTEGKFSGIGVVVGVRDHYPTVISPIEGSPAWKAGLHSGDVIVRIEGQSSADLTVEETAERLRGAEGTEVRISVLSEGESAEREVTLTRREIVTKSVPYSFALEDGIGYLRLANFSETSGAEVRAALARLRAASARSLILDLRANPGGLLDQAVDVAEQFLPEGTLVVYTHGRTRSQDHRYYAAEPKSEGGWPMVVLVDHGSASASEIVAGALQDRDRALLIGRTSFGKGSVQSVFPLQGRTVALKLTTALYYTPSGRSIHRAGRDSTAVDADAEDAPATEDTVAAAAADTASRPKFMTVSGRRVFGGGGITPDLIVAADTLAPIAAKVEQRGLSFRFANRWVNAHPRDRATMASGDGQWQAFADFLRAEKIGFEEAQLARERERLERSLERELARRSGGDSAAARVALAEDPVFQRAVRALAHARRPADVFAQSATGDAAEPARPLVGKRAGASRAKESRRGASH